MNLHISQSNTVDRAKCRRIGDAAPWVHGSGIFGMRAMHDDCQVVGRQAVNMMRLKPFIAI